MPDIEYTCILIRLMIGPTVHETGRGAAGSLFAAHISPDTPKEVQLAVVREAAEIAKMSIGTTVSKSTKADIGASGQVAIYFDKGLSCPYGHVYVTIFQT